MLHGGYKPVITIKLLRIQNPVGRKTEHIRAFGVRVDDLKGRLVEVPLRLKDAVDIINHLSTTQEFPEIEVEDRAWCHILNTGDVNMIFIKGEPA